MAEDVEPAQEEKALVPPADMYVRLKEEEHLAVVDHINRKAAIPNDPCPVCGDPNNSVTLDVYRIDALTNAPTLGGLHQPLYSTVCNNCGFVRFFNRFVVQAHIDLYKESLNAHIEPGPTDGS